MLQLARPVLIGTAEHKAVVPSRKVTEPVGVADAPLTVAVNVTVAPAVDGLADEASDAVADHFAMLCASALEVAGL